MKKIKKILCMTLAFVICMVTLTGCAELDFKNIQSELGSHTEKGSRFYENYNIAYWLHEQGFITKSTFDKIEENITKTEESFNTMILAAKKACDDNKPDAALSALCGATDGTDRFNVEKSAVAYLIQGEDGKADNKDEDNVYGYLSNFLFSEYYDFSGDYINAVREKWTFKASINGDTDWIAPKEGKLGGVDYNGECRLLYDKYDEEPIDCAPINIVPKKEVEKEIQESLELPIYVLRPDAGEKLNSTDLNQLQRKLQSALRNARDGKMSKSDLSMLNTYFYRPDKSTDKAGWSLKKLIEDSGAEAPTWNNIVCDSTWNTSDKNEMGKDLVLIEGDKPVSMHRVTEFNKESVDNFSKVIKAFRFNADEQNGEAKFGRYLVARADSNVNFNGAIYLLEYPVQRVSGISIIESTKDANPKPLKEELIFKDSGIGLNIMSGKMIKYNVVNTSGTSPTFTKNGVYIKTTDPYYTSAFFGDSGGSSFSIFGYSKTTLDLNDQGINKKAEIYIPQICLMDYLESTYAPKYETGDSKLVVFGRKIRFMTAGHIDYSKASAIVNLDGYNTTIYQKHWTCSTGEKGVAKYVDLNGNTGSREFAISDFADAARLKNKEECAYVCPANSAPSILDENPHPLNKYPTIYDLKQITYGKTINCIYPTLMFPSSDIGVADANAEKNDGSLESRQRFWTISVRLELSSSELITKWIENTSMNGDSLLWFDKYLEDNKFLYRVPLKDVENYFEVYYSNEMQEAGILMVDKDTIQDIKDMYDAEDSENRNTLIRTVFIIVGWLFMALSMIILLLWAIDANTDLGLNTLEKVTFGHWIAIKYESDIPNGETGSKSYLTGRSVLIRSMLLIAVGFILIRIDVFAIVHYIIVAFGKIASKIEEIIKGISGK